MVNSQEHLTSPFMKHKYTKKLKSLEII